MTIVRPRITARQYVCPGCQVEARQFIVRLAGFRSLAECPTCEHRHLVRLTTGAQGEARRERGMSGTISQ